MPKFYAAVRFSPNYSGKKLPKGALKSLRGKGGRTEGDGKRDGGWVYLKTKSVSNCKTAATALKRLKKRLKKFGLSGRAGLRRLVDDRESGVAKCPIK
jgi:hypothetical protein